MADHGEGLFGLGGLRLLVVEDNELCAEAVSKWLRICGARVATAATMNAALDCVRAERPDLLLVDVNLPDGTGWEVVERARAAVGDGSSLPAVAITGMPIPDAEGVARAHGVRRVVTKPIAPEALAEALAACL